MEKLKAQRKLCKSTITRAETWIEKHKHSAQLPELEFRYDLLVKAFNDFNAIQDEIEIVDEEEASGRELVEEQCGKIINEFKNCMKILSSTQNVPIVNSSSFIKLPELKVPPFSGDIRGWKPFFELFEKAVINNWNLSGAEKLTYLKSFLSGEALSLINNLSIQDANFQVAIDTLKNRFDNPLKTIYSHIENILEAPSLNKTTNLRSLHTVLKQSFDALDSLNGFNIDLLDLICVYIITQKLDAKTVEIFESNRDSKEYPTVKGLLEFMDKRCRVLETISESNIKQKSQQIKTSYHHVNVTQSSHESSHISKNKICIFCNLSNHTLYNCRKYDNLSHSEKRNFIKNKSLCFICLKQNHKTIDCKSNGCTVCKGRHHSSLHLQGDNSNINKNSQNGKNIYFNPIASGSSSSSSQFQQNSSVNTKIPSRTNQTQSDSNPNQTEQSSNDQSQNSNHQVLSTLTASGKALLATAEVFLVSANNKKIFARAVLDPCSTTSLIKNSLIEKLHYKTLPANISIGGVENICSKSNKIVNNVSVYSNVKQFKIEVNFVVVNNITSKLPHCSLKRENINIPSNITLADSKFHIPSDIDILLGADVYYNLITGKFVQIQNKFLTLLETHLGYVVGGSIPVQAISLATNVLNKSENPENIFSNTCLLSETTDQLLQRFWCIEEVPSHKKILSPDDEQAEKIFSNSAKQLKNGSYQVDLPLKALKENLKLGNSYYVAEKRFFSLENRFKSNKTLFNEYKKFIDEYVSLGHGKYVPLSLKNEIGEHKYFLPHHCVIRQDSQTTKLRVVFDAGAKSTSGYSLNDIMLKGFTVQPELFDILCRFRFSKFVLIADIEKMYRQVRINPSQTFLQNILWRDNPNDPLRCIELNTVTYGTNSAPFLATRTLNEIALKNQNTFPLAAEALLTVTYVDDILGTANSLDELKELYIQLTTLLNSANFNLHKWCSNSKHFLQSICNQKSQENYNIKSENVSSKVLGISWNSEYDYFSITLPQISEEPVITKRHVLSKIAQMFDPLGFIGPVIVTAKILMKKIWMSKLGWDDHLDSELSNEWNRFLENISQLSKLKIPRYLFLHKQIQNIEIHGFSDASLKAYGACIYIRAIYTDNTVSTNLVTSKSRIAPIKTVSVPRLELCAAVLLSKLTEKIISIFENKTSFTSVNLWTDSEITLCWLRAHPSKWTVFVANRVAEIQKSTANCSWRHIKSSENPADCLSRGISSSELKNFSLWWHGPQMLLDPNFKSKDITLNIHDMPEQRKISKKKETILHTSKKCEDLFYNLFLNFSSFTRLQRVIAFCLRFINNSNINCQKFQGPLTVNELQKSKTVIIKILQRHCFAQEIQELTSQHPVSNKSILQLAPFLDNSGLLRVGGRLSHSDLATNQKYPILLPSKNHTVSLLLKREHLVLGHAGAQTVLSNIRLNYWPLNGLREIKKIVHNCVTCYRFKAIACQQFMSDLPKDRVQMSRPFTKVGVDFGGPFFIRSSKLRKAPTQKSYMAMFVCMVTKAVHIELVSDLSTEAFLLTLKRFIARRGNPQVIYSDNATNFLGSKNQLKNFHNFFQNKENTEVISNFLSLKQIQWRFIPPKSPHWGGLWESAIKSAKYHIYRIVGDTRLTFEEFSTVLAQIEAILNSRPLVKMSNDPSDLSILTPGHFLIGDSLTSFSEPDITEIQHNKLSRWQLCAKMQQNFWNKWSKDYLNLLQNRPKWLKPAVNLKINDVVLLKEDNMRPLEWPLAKIVEILPSRDHKIRVVKVKIKDGIFTRNITKICPLPIDETN